MERGVALRCSSPALINPIFRDHDSVLEACQKLDAGATRL